MRLDSPTHFLAGTALSVAFKITAGLSVYLDLSDYKCYSYSASVGGRKMIKAEVLAEYPHIPTNIDPEIFLFS